MAQGFRHEGVSCRISAPVSLGTQTLQKVSGFVGAAMRVATSLAEIRSIRLRLSKLSSNLVVGLGDSGHPKCAGL